MTQAFVPLAPGSLQRSEVSAPVKLKALTPDSPQFQKTTPPEKPESHKSHSDPIVTLERDGDVITHIRVQCGCGQVTELKCSY